MSSSTLVGGGTPVSQARALAYVSVAQYNAIVTAEDANDGGDRAALLDAKLVARRASEPWPGE